MIAATMPGRCHWHTAGHSVGHVLCRYPLDFKAALAVSTRPREVFDPTPSPRTPNESEAASASTGQALNHSHNLLVMAAIGRQFGAGVEPATPRSSVVCSFRLSYPWWSGQESNLRCPKATDILCLRSAI